MSFSSILILIILLIVALVFIRRLKRKRRDVSMNRYRTYAKQTPKPNKIKRNRYSRPSRREPDLGYRHEAIQEEEPTPIKEVLKPDEDPDVVLGLKEPEEQLTLKPAPPPPPIITFHIMSEEHQTYNGYELMQAILSVGLRYGDRKIFHRHEDKSGQGPVLFSLASATAPGTFDLYDMGGFSTPGLSLFFRAADVEDPISVYELMLQTAGQLVEDMGGHVLDENRELLTPTKVVEQRQRLRDYLSGHEAPDLFEDTVDK